MVNVAETGGWGTGSVAGWLLALLAGLHPPEADSKAEIQGMGVGAGQPTPDPLSRALPLTAPNRGAVPASSRCFHGGGQGGVPGRTGCPHSAPGGHLSWGLGRGGHSVDV